ncbi:MAG: T9SS C-terminal target domain-containing protein [Cryomorphaceae bacterium]|nr:MAG: T9SS C-terminal target domain-containing protein [Cryomorphaceae bacterium]
MKKTLTLLTLFLSVQVILAQGFLDIVDMGGQLDYVRLPATNLFDEVETITENHPDYRGVLSRGIVLSPRNEDIQSILSSQAGRVKMNVPTPEGSMELWLVPSPSVGGNLPLIAASRRDYPIQDYKGKWFWGVVKDAPGSFVSVSIGEDEVMVFISFSDRDFTLAKLGESENYVVYRNSDLLVNNELGCAVDEEVHLRGKLRNEIQGGARDASNCVNQYVEVNHNVFLDKGSLSSTADYILGLFNQVGILYANELINFTVSELIIWDVPSPYSGPGASQFLNQFTNELNGVFNGDYAHLVGYGGGGGVAYLDVVCSNKFWRTAYSGIGSTYQNVPTYSWSVMVVTHELGHNLGSPHTHSCSWNGSGNPAIDGCGPAAGFSEGCEGPIPSNGGTVMSYCHLIGGVGINLSNGFGLQPGDLIRSRVHNAVCLGDCTPFQACKPLLEYELIADCEAEDFQIMLTIQDGADPENYNIFASVNGAPEVQVATNQPAGIYTFGIYGQNDIIDLTVEVVGNSDCDEEINGISLMGENSPLGCTDPAACNYDPNATCNDGSCIFNDPVTVLFTTDCWGEESSWEITDSTGASVFSVQEGAYASLQTYTTEVCLSEGCYTLIVSDGFGDGLFGSQYGSCSVDGDFAVFSASGDTLVKMLTPDFGFEVSFPFCLVEEEVSECVVSPVLSSVTPATIPCAGGVELQIEGANFCDLISVSIGGQNAEIISSSQTSVWVTAPAGSGVGLDVIVTTQQGVSNGLPVSYGAPVLTLASPPTFPCEGGIIVTLIGTNLCDATGVAIGGVSAPIISSGPTEVNVMVPPGTGTGLPVVVTTPSGVSNPLTVDYVAPFLFSVTPAEPACEGGSLLTLQGSNFCNASSVTIGGTPVSITSVTSTEIVVTAPSGSGVGLDVLVTTPSGVSNAVAVSYAAPVLTSVVPSNILCEGGTMLTLTGTNFCDATSVTIGGQAVTINSVSPTEIEVVSLPGSGSGLDVVVTTPSGVSNSLSVSYEAPNLTFVAPTTIPCAGNITMTLVGTNFCDATSVTIGGVNAPIMSVDPTMIIATALPGTGSNLSVVVTTPSGVSNALLVSYAPPVLNSVTPSVVPCEGGASLTLLGTDFCSASSVTIGGSPVMITSVTPTEIVVTAPSGSGVDLDVVVTTPSGVSNAVAVSYAAPVLTSVVPSNIPCEGGTTLTLTGTNFCDATAVTIGGVAASINSITPTQMEVTSPPGSGLNLDVVVSTPSGTSNAVQVSYEAPGLILVAPALIPCEGNTTITLIGSNLCNATSVTIGGVIAPIVSADPTQIVATTPPGTGTGVGVTVTTPSGVSNTIPVNYSLPVLTSVNPIAIPCEGGVPLTIQGSDFCGVTSVTIGGVLTAISSATSTEIIVTAPAGTGENLDVLVTTPSGTSNALQVGYLPCEEECELDYTYTTSGATIGYANGSATITVTGGQPPYSYQWNDPFMQTGQTLFGVFPGTYLCTVTDANNCTDTFEVFIGFESNVPTTQVHPNFCNTGGYALGDFIQAISVQSATAYRWQFSVGGNTLPEYTRNASNPWMRLSWIDGIELDVTYDVRVKARVNEEWGEYGDICTITTSSEVPQTELRPEYHVTNGAGDPYVMCDLMIAYAVSGATDYRWRLDPDSDPNNGNEIYYTRGTGNPSVRLSWMGGLQPMQTYQVAVEAAIGDAWSGFGNVHNITLGPPAMTQVRPNHCGVTYGSLNTVISAQSVCIADYYEFQLVNSSTGITSMATRPNAAVLLSSNDVNPALTPGTYNASVRVQQGGVLGSWGPVCTFTIASPGQESPMPEGQQATLQAETNVTLYPNPMSGTVIWLEADELPDNHQQAIVQLHDVYGKVLHSATLNYEGSRHTEAIELGRSLASGIYIMQMTVDGKWIAAERLVVQ